MEHEFWESTLHGVARSSLTKDIDRDTSYVVTDGSLVEGSCRQSLVAMEPWGYGGNDDRRIRCFADEYDEDDHDGHDYSYQEEQGTENKNHTLKLNYRDRDPVFNALLEKLHNIERAVEVSQTLALPAPRKVPPLADLELRCTDHTRCPTTDRKFVPAGAAKATECSKTRAGSFPHIIQQVEEEEGGGLLYHIITSNNIFIVAGVHHVDDSCNKFKVSEEVVLARANRELRDELQANGEYPLHALRMRMRLVAAHIPHTDASATPIGVGPNRWWDRDLSTEIDGSRDKQQLLIPAEVDGAYVEAILNGRVGFSFKIRSGVTSPTCRAHKKCLFRIVVEPESYTLRQHCEKLTALTAPFKAWSKYSNSSEFRP
jgi:hypothetical protein